MLKLKRVEIHGFKSFYDRTEMKFSGSGIAAVVGPNGCGKSNLSDAISWVLGEQSAKTLRGARMEDVIFAGTRDRKALGMAAVTMTLVPDESAVYRHHPVVEVAESSIPVSPEPPAEGPAPLLEGQEPVEAIAIQVETNGHGHATNGTNGHSPLKSDVAKAAERTGEITITRRLYRSGESEYLINGKLARLRDIQDLFLGTGLGPESYAIIEQGRIGQILSNKPQDRRSVIEEAAGITRFKTRKRLAEARLEGAKQNLSRVFDILEEVTRQVNSLKRQSSKTKRYGELKAEGTAYLRQLLAAKFKLLEREAAQAAIELNLATNELKDLQTTVGAKALEQSATQEASYAIDRQLTEARKQLADLQLEAERTRGRLEYQVRQIEQISQRLSASEVEARELERQEQEGRSELTQQSAELTALEAQRQSARELLDSKSQERLAAQARLTECERSLEATRQQVIRLLGESSGLKNRITQAEAQQTSSDRESSRAKAEEQQAELDLTRIHGLREQLSERLMARQIELTSVTDQRRAVEQELQFKRSALNETRHSVERFRSEYSRIKARRDSLAEVLSHRTYTTETVKRLFTAIEHDKAHGLKPVGVLADFIEVDSQFEKATEEFLHEELEFVVVRDWADAERGIDLLRTDLDGRATFLVEQHEAPSGEGGSSTRKPLSEEAGVVTSLSAALRFTNGLSHAPLDLLPRVASCFLTTDRAAAQRLAVEYPECSFLAPDGVSYQGHAVSGGKKTGAGPLALKRELREVSELEHRKLAELNAEQLQLAGLERETASLGEQLEALRSKQQTEEKDVLALDHESRKLAEEFQRVNTRLSSVKLELERIVRDRAGIEERLELDRAQLEAKETARTGQEEALEAARAELQGQQTELVQISEAHATLRANLASFEERHRALTENCARLEARIHDLENRRANLSCESELLSTERTNLETNNAELTATADRLAASVLEVSASVDELARQESDVRAKLALAEEELKTLRAAVQTGQDTRSNLQVTMARLESDLKHLQETAQNELDSTLDELSEGMEVVPDEAGLAEIDGKYQEVRRKIEALGPVNPQALEEFEEAQQRQEFLNAQRQDLLDSIRDTEKAIHEIEAESQKRFGEAFHAINANFKAMFSNLFGGGVGEMRLTDEENLAESGIDIVASPPGKKLQNVLLLSGGEKSLTAMALLMSIFQYTPSPFCILDEVDAPLDEPNIERLTKLLRSMSEQTQFIVITHAKRTMEAAQSLYGVTMQEPGVSKLVSVKFKPEAEVEKNRAAAQAAAAEKQKRVYETVGV